MILLTPTILYAVADTQLAPTTHAIGWFTLSLINAGLAQAKGRSGLNWWLVSLLLGPMATLLIVLRERMTPKAERGGGSEGRAPDSFLRLGRYLS